MSSNFLTPQEINDAVVESWTARAGLSIRKLLILGFLAGVYIGFAAHLATTIATGSTEWFGLKKFMTGAVFSFGLMLVIIPGSELWTGNNLMLTPLMSKRITLNDLLRNWLFVYFANLAGTVFLATMIAGWTGILDGQVGATAIKIAYSKINTTPEGIDHNTAYFFRAVGCNWLVCLAILIAISAKDISGKILGIFFPIMAFVASGFEHSVANMYFIPAGIIAKKFSSAVQLSGLSQDMLASINWSNMWTKNIITVTLGNLAGGGLFTAMAYWTVFQSGKNKS